MFGCDVPVKNEHNQGCSHIMAEKKKTVSKASRGQTTRTSAKPKAKSTAATKPKASAVKTNQNAKKSDPSRRDFLVLASGAAGALGAASFLYPFVNSMNPAADTAAGAEVDIDLSPIQDGQAVTVMWRGKPIFIRKRTADEISTENAVDVSVLPDPQADKDRVVKPEWLVVVGVCTHLGCVPTGQKPTDNRGSFGGWFCPCHGSAYDRSGRIRQGPAPKNLEVPPYVFLNESTIRIGQESLQNV